VPFGVIGQRRIKFTVEHSFPDLLGSDFPFTSYKITIDGRLNTFLRRRFLPNSLDFRLVAGTSTGKLPVQRFGSLDVSMGSFSPFGVFRTLTGHPLEGEKYFGFFWEHNFRTVPFELLGLRGLAKKGLGIIIHGAVGRTWISEKRRSELDYQYHYLDHLHNEIGFSLNGLFGLFRFDVTRCLDKPGTFLGFGLARMF